MFQITDTIGTNGSLTITDETTVDDIITWYGDDSSIHDSLVNAAEYLVSSLTLAALRRHAGEDLDILGLDVTEA